MALLRTAKSCGSDAPMPASSLREEAQATVSNKHGHREEREVSRKTIARGMPGCSGVTVVTTLVCFFISHARLRAHRARHSLRPLISGGHEIQAKLARKAAARSRSRVCRHCVEQSDEAIHSSFAWRNGLLRGACHSRDPLARNDGIKTCHATHRRPCESRDP